MRGKSSVEPQQTVTAKGKLCLEHLRGSQTYVGIRHGEPTRDHKSGRPILGN